MCGESIQVSNKTVSGTVKATTQTSFTPLTGWLSTADIEEARWIISLVERTSLATVKPGYQLVLNNPRNNSIDSMANPNANGVSLQYIDGVEPGTNVLSYFYESYFLKVATTASSAWLNLTGDGSSTYGTETYNFIRFGVFLGSADNTAPTFERATINLSIQTRRKY